MSPRSQEFMDDARRRLDAARTTLESDLPFVVVGQAYYAMLYAARAALSEENLYAKTHSGTWTLFRQTFVQTGRFAAELTRSVERVRELRERADYDADSPSLEVADEATRAAEQFVAAVDDLLGHDR